MTESGGNDGSNITKFPVLKGTPVEKEEQVRNVLRNWFNDPNRVQRMETGSDVTFDAMIENWNKLVSHAVKLPRREALNPLIVELEDIRSGYVKKVEQAENEEERVRLRAASERFDQLLKRLLRHRENREMEAAKRGRGTPPEEG